MKNLRPETLGLLQRIETLSGRPVEFKPDATLTLRATLQLARNGAPAHVLRYRPVNEPIDYWVAYQAGYLLRLLELPPDEALRSLVAFTWNYFLAHPEFLTLLNSANLHRARHLEGSARARSLNSPLIESLGQVLERGRETGLLQALQQRPRVAGAFSKAVMLRNVEGITARNLLVFSAVLTAFASVIAVGVVYNQTRIALAERAWELASLRVLGFTQAEVSGLLLGQWLLEMLIALPLGWWGGWWLSGSIVRLVQTDEFFFAVHIRPATYAFASVCVVVAALLSAWMVNRRIRHLDLVGVLKVRE